MISIQQTRFQLATAILFAVIGSAFFNLQPLFLAAAQSLFVLTDSQVGWLAATELSGIALASLLLTIFTGDFNYRIVSSAGLFAIVLGNTATLFADNFSQLLIVRFATGLMGDGMVYISAILLLGRSSSPTRMFGLMVFINMAVTAINLQFLPKLFPNDIWQGLLLFLIIIAVTGLLFVFFLPGKRHNTLANPVISGLDRQATLLLLAVCAFAINLGVVWSYAERIGSHAGLSLDEIATYLSYSLPLQATGALLAVIFGMRFGSAKPMVLVVVLQLIAVGMLIKASPDNDWLFFGGISAWGFSWNLGIAYLLGQAAVMRSGLQILILVPCAEAIGVSTGPAIAAALVNGSHYLPVHVTAVAAAIVSAVFYFLVSRTQVYVRA